MISKIESRWKQYLVQVLFLHKIITGGVGVIIETTISILGGIEYLMLESYHYDIFMSLHYIFEFLCWLIVLFFDWFYGISCGFLLKEDFNIEGLISELLFGLWHLFIFNVEHFISPFNNYHVGPCKELTLAYLVYIFIYI